MEIYQGRSDSADPQVAVSEATAEWVAAEPEIVFVFSSTKQDPVQVAAAMSEKFPHAKIVGCTTSGELLNGAHQNGSLVATGVRSQKLHWESARLSLSDLSLESTQAVVDDLFGRLGTSREDVDSKRYFAILFVDGLSMREEVLASFLGETLEGIPLVGGSAGDDLNFGKTHVYCDGQAWQNSATLVLCKSELEFKALKHQHFVNTERSLVITKADPEKRLVLEINGYPAAEAYARALGVEVDELDDVTFLHPVTFSSEGEIYVRSIQTVNGDGSIAFYCAIEEGMVLHLASHQDIDQKLEDDFASQAAKPIRFLLACNCILRSLEANQEGKFGALEAVMRRYADCSIGFDSYGEQFNGLHVNQTLVGLAIMAEEEAA